MEGSETGVSGTLQETCSLRDFAPSASLAETDAAVHLMREPECRCGQDRNEREDNGALWASTVAARV